MKTGCNGINKVTDEEVQIVYGAAINLIYKTVIKEMEK
jgi:phosphotransferase system IIB component